MIVIQVDEIKSTNRMLQNPDQEAESTVQIVEMSGNMITNHMYVFKTKLAATFTIILTSINKGSCCIGLLGVHS